MSNEHVSTWTASVYTVHVAMFPRGSACVYIAHVAKTNIRNYFAKPRQLFRIRCLQFVMCDHALRILSQWTEKKYYYSLK